MQALLPSQVPSGSAVAKLRQEELDTLQGKGRGPSFEPEVWDRVYQVSHQVWQSRSTELAGPLPRCLEACSLKHERLLAVQHHWDHCYLLPQSCSTVCHAEVLGPPCLRCRRTVRCQGT